MADKGVARQVSGFYGALPGGHQPHPLQYPGPRRLGYEPRPCEPEADEHETVWSARLRRRRRRRMLVACATEGGYCEQREANDTCTKRRWKAAAVRAQGRGSRVVGPRLGACMIASAGDRKVLVFTLVKRCAA